MHQAQGVKKRDVNMIFCKSAVRCTILKMYVVDLYIMTLFIKTAFQLNTYQD